MKESSPTLSLYANMLCTYTYPYIDTNNNTNPELTEMWKQNDKFPSPKYLISLDIFGSSKSFESLRSPLEPFKIRASENNCH